jgi:hypothetical protein
MGYTKKNTVTPSKKTMLSLSLKIKLQRNTSTIINNNEKITPFLNLIMDFSELDKEKPIIKAVSVKE